MDVVGISMDEEVVPEGELVELKIEELKGKNSLPERRELEWLVTCMWSQGVESGEVGCMIVVGRVLNENLF